MEENSLKLDITNEEEDLIVPVKAPFNFSKIKEKLKLIATKENEKYRILTASWNDIELEVKDYFEEFSTADEIEKGLKKLEKDLTNIENVNKDKLLEFMFDYVDESEYKCFAEEYIQDIIEQDMLDSYSILEIWGGLMFFTKEELISEYMDNTSGWSKIYEENANNAEIMKCIFENTAYSPKELFEKIQIGDTENGTN